MPRKVAMAQAIETRHKDKEPVSIELTYFY
jgi:hypothetical protein